MPMGSRSERPTPRNLSRSILPEKGGTSKKPRSVGLRLENVLLNYLLKITGLTKNNDADTTVYSY